MRILSLPVVVFLLAAIALAQNGPGADTQPSRRTPPAVAGSVEVYASAFATGKAGEQWSNGPIAKCPSGTRTFLGSLSAESTTLSLDNLPEHARVRVSFDLLIMLSWDGDLCLEMPTEVGPDSINVTVHGGPRLLNASFVCPPSSANTTQSFPGMFPYDHVPVGTGALESGSLGYVWGGIGPGKDNYVYHVERTFGHSAKSLKIAFSGINLQGKGDEEWGLDNVKVQVLPAAAPQPIDPRVLDRLWSALGEESPTIAVPAVAALVELGDLTVAEIHKRPEAPATQPNFDAAIAKLLVQLDSDTFPAREQASAALKQLGSAAEPPLRKAGQQAWLSPEVKGRIEAILADMAAHQSETPADRRARRLVEVLELIGTDDARKTLTDIAAHATGFTAYEAKAAVRRLDGTAPIPTKLELPDGLAASPYVAPASPPLAPEILQRMLRD